MTLRSVSIKLTPRLATEKFVYVHFQHNCVNAGSSVLVLQLDFHHSVGSTDPYCSVSVIANGNLRRKNIHLQSAHYKHNSVDRGCSLSDSGTVIFTANSVHVNSAPTINYSVGITEPGCSVSGIANGNLHRKNIQLQSVHFL